MNEPAQTPVINNSSIAPQANAHQVAENAFAHSACEVLSALGTQETGLDQSSVQKRSQQYGPNALPMAPPKPTWIRFAEQFNNILIYVLIASALVSLALKHFVDTGVIIAVVFINAIIGFIQEGKAEAALRAILSMTKTHCLVVRKGALMSLDSSELVPGDVVTLQPGDRVPADIRLFYCKDLRCDEALLTGESQPVSKHVDIVAADSLLADRNNMAFMGTMVTYGMARGVVCQTGVKTQIGAINELVQHVEIPQTPLQKQLSLFAGQLTTGILFLAALTMVFGVFVRDYTFSEMFQGAIGIAVAAIPEGLPAIVTITLAIGVQRMSRENALVRRLPAVEVLGSVDVICSDKTGTLTANAMTVRHLSTFEKEFSVTGEGYSPQGEIRDHSGVLVNLDQDEVVNFATRIAILCNDSSVVEKDNDWVVIGDPTEGALFTLALKHGIVASDIAQHFPRIDALPFDTDKRYMATLNHDVHGKRELLVKGAPERIFQFCTYQQTSQGVEAFDEKVWQEKNHQLASKGMRVIALAYKIFVSGQELSEEEVENDLVIVGLTGISDPPRPEAIEAIKRCHNAGIRVKMITGDNPITAAAIGDELNLNTARVLTGQDIDNLNHTELVNAIEAVDIFARTSPANKLQLVKALQERDHTVAMTGDGVNDAPALRRADIGVAMGLKGTDAAKEAADFVLTDDNFSTIATAVAQGRTVYDNIVKSIVFILPTNLAEASIIILAILMGKMLPITAAQILWVNMITAVTLALALAFEKSEKNIMARPPRPCRQGFITIGLLRRMILVGSAGAATVFLLFSHYRSLGVSIEYARTIAVNTLVMFEAFYLLNCRMLYASIMSKQMLIGIKPAALAITLVIVFQLIFTYLPASQTIFALESITWQDWLLITVCACSVLFIVELEKLWVSKRSA